MKRLFINVMLLVIAGTLSTGCASFQKNMLPKLSSSQISGGGTTATYTFGQRVQIFGDDLKPAPNSSPLVTSFVTTMSECGITCQPKSALLSPDIHMDIEHTWYGGNWAHPLWGFVTGYSLFTLPMWQPQDHSIQAVITQTGRKQKIYNLKDGSTSVTWLPMLLAAPFTYSNNQKNPVLPNIYRNLAYKLQQDGFLSNSDISPSGIKKLPAPVGSIAQKARAVADKIREMEQLFKEGLITEGEYKRKKQELLSDM